MKNHYKKQIKSQVHCFKKTGQLSLRSVVSFNHHCHTSTVCFLPSRKINMGMQDTNFSVIILPLKLYFPNTYCASLPVWPLAGVMQKVRHFGYKVQWHCKTDVLWNDREEWLAKPKALLCMSLVPNYQSEGKQMACRVIDLFCYPLICQIYGLEFDQCCALQWPINRRLYQTRSLAVFVPFHMDLKLLGFP